MTRRLPRVASILTAVAFLTAALFVVVQLQRIGSEQQHWENPLGSFGTRDLIAFWAGIQVFRNGDDPYQSSNVLDVQREVIDNVESAQVFLNPPWALPLLFPFLSPPFEVTRLLWLLVNLTFGVLVAIFLRRDVRSTDRLPGILGAGFLFFPTVQTLWMGQLSLLTGVSLVAFLCALRAKRDVLAGLAILPLSLKPHLVLPLLAYVGFVLVRERRWSFFLTAVPAFLALAALPVVVRSGVYSEWLAMDFSPLDYRTATLATRVRDLLEWATGYAAVWPAILLPALAACGASVLAWRRKELPFEWPVLLPLISLSLLCAPYCWPYDFTLLLPAQILPVLWAGSQRIRFRVFLILALLQAAYVVEGLVTNDLGATFWFPAAILLPWLAVFRSQKWFLKG